MKKRIEYRPTEGYTQMDCGCIMALHLQTGAPTTNIAWCNSHRPMISLTGKPVKSNV
jgi:hypothetical protein